MMKSRSLAYFLACLAFALPPGVTHATVVQVDGTIVPVQDGAGCAGNMQQCLDDAEGVAAPDPNAIDAILDAAQLPEIFLPNTTMPVTFQDIFEGAGFENSFGYYNIGDDLTDTSNLHPILGCGVPAATHTSEAAGYVVDAEAGDTATIDFAVEEAAGRYRGGFIGFYLIAPEGRPGGTTNCGDFTGSSFFGRIYFTQRALNNDGDFVHHLVYSSRLVTDRFYFGFEDLFRGGDNDFEDMLIQVTGLTPPCVPGLEVCNGRDDDCDGLVDGDDPSLSDAGMSCVCDGTGGLPCEGGGRLGICQQGATECVGGALLCRSGVPPSAETCNGLDDNCDGTTDNATVDSGGACDGPDADLCEEGVLVCESAVLVCNDTTGANLEICNDGDDDCDGAVDEDLSGLGVPCDGADGDLCLEGVTTCVGGVELCDDATSTTGELCNGADDDCDGDTDEAPSDVGAACSVGVGRCQRSGATACRGGSATCSASPGTPRDELCNALDDDCDGSLDEGFMLGNACVAPGVCGAGVIECAGQRSTRCSTAPGGSADGSSPETCNGLDDDCDGDVDEGLTDLGACGESVGACVPGRLRCLGGAPTCVGAVGPQSETCDGADNDCDRRTDESPIDAGGSCGTDVGQCTSGSEQCMGGSLTCVGATGPSDEACDSLDNDCDGNVDEGLTDLGACGSNRGECSRGRRQCVGGMRVCVGGVEPLPENCDGLDNDCDGSTDEEPVDAGGSCGSDVGACEAGIEACVSGALVCEGATGPGDEVCNGADDDCDSVTDETPSDVDVPCGVTDEGVCERGRTICVEGAPVCAGATGPSAEVCNGLDDDCDGSVDNEPIDIGRTCGSAMGTCIPGMTVCVEGEVLCEGATAGEAETCNGIDDDCDTVIDEDPIDEGGSCGMNEGVCELGELRCVAAEIQCVGGVLPGTEVCNGLDDDCNGIIDDGELCENGTCRGGRCSVPCVVTEFGERCPPGDTCVEGFCVEDECFEVECPAGMDGTRNVCQSGGCTPICDTVNCEEPNVCRRSDGACVGNNCIFLPYLCGEAEACVEGECVADPCAEVSCEEDQFCRQGSCVASCAGVRCGDTEVCRGGTCEPTGCEVACREGRVCDAATGECAPNPCPTLDCATGEVCDPAMGACIDDACRNIECPGEERCVLGECVERRSSTGDMDAGVGEPDAQARDLVLATGGGGSGGCAAATGSAPRGLPLSLLALFGLVFLRRRRSRRSATDARGRRGDTSPADTASDCAASDRTGNGSLHPRGIALAVCLSLLLGGCNVDPYCIDNCGEEMPQDGGPLDGGDAMASSADADVEADACVPGAEEECNGEDDDCDSAVDEDFDLNTDLRHCGACDNSCSRTGAQTECNEGSCAFVDCFGGFLDLNEDTTGPFEDTDGCEYMCFESNGGVEVCDEIDNDCDGATDEDFDFQTDDTNCGRCGRVCTFFRVSGGTCQEGTCAFDPATDCDDGYIDTNGVQSDGCEFECTPAPDGVELCNGLDDDCDTRTDETFDLESDLSNCGRCGLSCDFRNATARCTAGVCNFDPAMDCDAGFSDRDGEQLNGCEYPCTPTADPTEICDGLDNDCDGRVDGATSDAGGACNAAPSGTATGVCSDTGVLRCIAENLVCTAAPEPTSELCNGLDDDCDGTVDDAPIDAGRLCEPPRGVCSAGFTVCTAAGALECERSVGPSEEVCNGLDDDCDGRSDESPTDAQLGRSCGEATGACEPGVWSCSGGTVVCAGATVARAETCNGLDDDCDGVVDDTPNDVGAICETAQGICSAGFTVCSGGRLECDRAFGPSAETCNGLDDDCDGSTDESPTDAELGSRCGVDTGECRAGTWTCAGGAVVCEGSVGGALEICNGLDDDCDGMVDDTPVDTGGSCGSSVGACVAGTEVCSGGRLVCSGGVSASAETCDGQDNDCNGAIDEGLSRGCYSGAARTRGVGECRDGVQACTGGTFAACSGQVLPSVEICDNEDDDCDGSTDEGLTQSCYTGPGGTLGVGRCAAGVRTCSAGSFGSCAGQVRPTGEICNNIDDDCDGAIDEDAGGGPLTRSCYSGGAGTAGVGTCGSGVQTCRFGAYDVCSGEVVPAVDLCGDGLDTDCDGNGDAAEGCLGAESDVRVDTGNGAGATHSYDVRVAYGGAPSGRRIYAVWVDKRNGLSEADIFFARSSDGGASWSAPTDLTTSTGNRTVAPEIAVGRSGGEDIVHVAYQRVASGRRQVWHTVSTNSGASFSGPDRLDTTGSTDNFKHHVATSDDGARVVVAWEQLDTGNLDRNVVSRASSDTGASFAGERVVSRNVGGTPTAGAPRVLVTDSGRFVFVWRESRPPARGTFDIYATYSDGTSGAMPPGREVRLDGDTAQTRASDNLRIAGDGENVYVTWSDISTTMSGAADIAFVRSTNGGASYSSEIFVDDPMTGLSASSEPAIAIDPRTASASDDRVWLAWTDTRDGSQIFVATSTNSGSSFGSALRASQQDGGPVPGVSSAPSIAYAGSDAVVVAYVNDEDTTSTPFRVQTALSIDAGSSWQLTDGILDSGGGDAVQPAVARANGSGISVGAAVVWVDFRSGSGVNGDIYSARVGR